MSVTDWAGRRLEIDRQPDLDALRLRVAAELLKTYPTRAVGAFFNVSHVTAKRWAERCDDTGSGAGADAPDAG